MSTFFQYPFPAGADSRRRRSSFKSSKIISIRKDVLSALLTIFVFLFMPYPWGYSYELRMNAGGDSLTTADGRYFLADAEYEPGSAGFLGGEINPHVWLPVGGAADVEEVYRSYRIWFDEFRADVPSDSFVLTLHFCETEVHGPGFRVLSIQAEDETLLDSLDIFERVDHTYALPLRFHVQVSDGQLNVKIIPHIGAPVLSGFELVSDSPDGIAPAFPDSFSSSDGYRGALLTWSPPDEIIDCAGIHVYRIIGSGSEERLTTGPILVPYFVDAGVSPNTTASYALRSVDVYDNVGDATPWRTVMALLPSDSNLPVYGIEVEPDSLRVLQAEVHGNDYVEADFTAGGVFYPQSELRFRGNVGRIFPKKSFKVRLPDETVFNGRTELNLNADYADGTHLRSKLGFDLFAEAGIRPPECRIIHLQINGGFAGVYKDVEQIDERFLERTGRSSRSAIYKAFGNLGLLASEYEYEQFYEKKTYEDEGHDDLIEFIELINLTSPQVFPSAIIGTLDMVSYLRYLSVITVTGNGDFTVRNYYLIHDLDADRWEILPWDLDLSFGLGFPFEDENVNQPPIQPDGIGGPNMLMERVLGVPAFRRYYCEEIESLLYGAFDPERVAGTIDSLNALIGDDTHLDVLKLGRDDNTIFDGSAEFLKQFVADRGELLFGELQGYMPGDSIFVFINEVQPVNESTITDENGEYESWLEIYNLYPESVSLEGWSLHIDGISWTFPDSTLRSGDHLLVWLDGEYADGPFHGPEYTPFNGISLRKSNEEIDSVDIPGIPPDWSFGRAGDGAAVWDSMSIPTPGTSNSVQTGSGPVITEVVHTPQWPDENQEVTITARVVPGEHPLSGVQALIDSEAGFVPRNMHDDGLHGDGAAGDSVYGYIIDSEFAPPEFIIRYMVLATDIGGTTTIYPESGSPGQFVYGWRPPGISLNEFMADNDTVIPDEHGDYDDWIELSVTTGQPVSLFNLFLSDDPSEPAKWGLPEELVDDGSFLIIWADGEPEEGPRHADFKLDADGEFIGMYARLANGVWAVDSLHFGEQEGDISMGRYPDGTGIWGITASPTPGASNTSLGGERNDQPAMRPDRLKLQSIRPIPSDGEFSIRLAVPEYTDIDVSAYDIGGRIASSLWRGSLPAGWHDLSLNADLPSGVWVVVVRSSVSISRKYMIVMH